MKDSLKVWFFEMIKDDDNIKHSEMSDSVDLISVPITENNLDNNEQVPHPELINRLKSHYSFKGNIRLSNSGKSWCIYRDVLDTSSDLVTVELPEPF